MFVGSAGLFRWDRSSSYRTSRWAVSASIGGLSDLAEPLQVVWQPWATCLIWQSHSRLLLWDTLKSCVTLALVFRILPTCLIWQGSTAGRFWKKQLGGSRACFESACERSGSGTPPPEMFCWVLCGQEL